MDLTISGDFAISVSALNLFDSFAIILLIPVFERVIFPYFKNKGRPMTMLQKIGWGYVFAALAVLVAGIVEIYRKKYVRGEDGPFPWGRMTSVPARTFTTSILTNSNNGTQTNPNTMNLCIVTRLEGVKHSMTTLLMDIWTSAA